MPNYRNLPLKIKQLAFVFWLQNIGYRGTLKPCGTLEFYCPVVNARFPRNVKIISGWGFNKPAKQLYIEFLGHLEA